MMYDQTRRGGDGIAAIFSEPPLYPGEDKEEFQALLHQVRLSVRPKEAVEEIYIQEAVEYVWEARRYRRLRNELVSSSRYNGLWRMLANLKGNPRERAELLMRWTLGDETARLEVAKLLADAGMQEDQIHAHTTAAMIKYVETFDRLALQASRRFETLLREIERRHESFARRLRDNLLDPEEIRGLAPNGSSDPYDT